MGLVLQEVVSVGLALLEGCPVVVVVGGVGRGEGGGGEVGAGGGDALHHRLLLHRLPLPRLDDVLPQLCGSVLAVHLEVESAGVAHGHVLLDPSPQRGCCCRTVGARSSFRSRLA